MPRKSLIQKVKSAAPFSIILVIFAGVVWLLAWDIKNAHGKRTKIAIRGYDIMSYYKENRAVKGDPAITWRWNGQIWRFSKPEHKEIFMANPDTYAPKYGGNCAFTTSLGKAQSGLPTNWQFIDGKLYLNANTVSHFLWKKMPNRIQKADREWTRMNREKAENQAKKRAGQPGD